MRQNYFLPVLLLLCCEQLSHSFQQKQHSQLRHGGYYQRLQPMPWTCNVASGDPLPCIPSWKNHPIWQRTRRKTSAMMPRYMSSSTSSSSDSDKTNEQNKSNKNKDSNNKPLARVRELKDARKMRTTIGYRLSFLTFLVLGGCTMFWQGIKTIYLVPTISYFSAGPLLASGVAYVLEGAAINDRLGNDTYKRLNLYLIHYASLWLLASLLVCRSKPLSFGVKILTNPAVLAFSLATVLNGFKAYTYGVKGWEKSENNSRRKDLWTGIQNTIPVLTSIKNIPGAFYWTLTTWMGCLQIQKLIELFQLIIDSTVTGPYVATRVIRYAKLALLTIVSLTLKDAADQQKLNDTSFMELNFVLSYVLWTMGGRY